MLDERIVLGGLQVLEGCVEVGDFIPAQQEEQVEACNLAAVRAGRLCRRQSRVLVKRLQLRVVPAEGCVVGLVDAGERTDLEDVAGDE